MVGRIPMAIPLFVEAQQVVGRGILAAIIAFRAAARTVTVRERYGGGGFANELVPIPERVSTSYNLT